jgi:AcrR family transcriptional regulator
VADTKQKLIDGALTAIRTHGIAGTSARTIAAAAGVNQALVFYHFGSVDDLIATACRVATEERVASYRPRLATVGSLRELLDLGRTLHVEERAAGNVRVLAQTLAGAQMDEKLVEPTAAALALRRVLADSPLTELADPAGLARAVSAAFVGLELYDGVDPAGAESALDALEQLSVLVEVVDSLGPIARRALRSRARKTARR